MQVGLIGAGNMTRAIARGWGDPVLVADGLAAPERGGLRAACHDAVVGVGR